ncbi:hypothetical protein [Salinicola halimionae]|uniref:hypothetical protein n=1 Tax=Salinicola halimionae TaxID=1949081 RepID=UPI001FD8847E|nr:hypothetical protein [Salinicola halimionae]
MTDQQQYELALVALKSGYVLVFDIKDGMEAEQDDEFFYSDAAFVACRDILFEAYCDTENDEDPEGRTYRQLESPEDLSENFREDANNYWCFLVPNINPETTDMPALLEFCRQYCFFPPETIIENGKVIDTRERIDAPFLNL